MPGLNDVEYVLPLKANEPAEPEFVDYILGISSLVDVTVVDASAPDIFRANATQWAGRIQHIAPDYDALPADRGVLNGKVVGVLTGLDRARHDCVIIADDDVRYSSQQLAEIAARLDTYGVVRPQNYFAPHTWHSQWDTARTLINRAFSSDYPGTLAVRRRYLPDGYRADVLFENLELIRTVVAHGGRELRANDLFVRRLPPSSTHFVGQRVRQAYDSLTQPARLAIELALLPALVAQARRPRGYVAWIIAAVAIAEVGRRRDRGREVFAASASLWAPVWVCERAITSWAAMGYRLRGGVPYAGARLRAAATPLRQLRRSA